MPFTVSHMAAAIPVACKKRKYIDITAFILGTMAPDFEYFLNFKPSGKYGHTLFGFFTVNLIMCFLIAFIFHRFVKKDLIKSMPKSIEERFVELYYFEFKINEVKKIFIFALSAILGMFTHVLWDSFTHQTGYFVVKFSVFTHKMSFLGNVPVYKFLQHFSTLLGAVAIFIYILKLSRTQGGFKRIKISEKIYYWIQIILVFLVVIYIRIISRYFNGIYIGLGEVVVTFINAFILGILLITGLNFIKKKIA